MSLLDRYIGASIVRSFVLVILVLLPLFSFLDLIQQLDDVGTGRFGLADAFLFEFLMLPQRGLDFLPFAALMGCAIGLGLLAHHGELIAMQATGISVARIALAVVKTGALLMLLAAVLDEFVVSPLHQYAVQRRSLAISDTQVLQHEEGFWIHYGDRFVNIGEVLHGRLPATIDIFEVDAQNGLRAFIHANRADISDPERWRLREVVLKHFRDDGQIITQPLPEISWESYLTSEQIGLLELAPRTLSPSQLYRYIRYLESSAQKTDRYELAFWQKLTLPFATGAMILLAIPFAFGSPRATSLGKRIILAIAVGVGFQILNQVAANLGLILELRAPVVTLSPVVLVLGIAAVRLHRVRA